MTRRERWQAVLDAELKAWAMKSYDELRTELSELKTYEVEFDSVQHQVEIQLLEDTPDYVHVCISVDDGALPASLRPATSTFIRKKEESG
jgi:hypothetical protein